MEKFLLDPNASEAFSPDVMHKVVLNGIDFELPDNIWDVIDDAFGNYWNVEVGYGGWPDFNSAVISSVIGVCICLSISIILSYKTLTACRFT